MGFWARCSVTIGVPKEAVGQVTDMMVHQGHPLDQRLHPLLATGDIYTDQGGVVEAGSIVYRVVGLTSTSRDQLGLAVGLINDCCE